MAAKKHSLTITPDKITGGAGKDIFIAGRTPENYELNSGDRLDGGGGVDTIRAALGDMLVAPVMKRIEKGIFWVAQDAEVTLDLAKAQQMRSITIDTTDNHLATQLFVEHAKSVNTIAAVNGSIGASFQISDLNSSGHKTLSLLLDGTDCSLGAFTISGKPFAEVQVTLDGALNSTIWGGAFSARDVTIKSTGGVVNQITYDPGQYTGTTRHLTIKGNTSFVLNDGGADIFEHLYSLDLTGIKELVQMRVGGEKLTSVVAGAGSQYITLSDLGGGEKHKADIRLGAGGDGVTLLAGCFDASTQRFDGGAGGDLITFFGNVADIAKSVRNFEEAYFQEASGIYDLGELDLDITLASTQDLVTFDRLKDGTSLTLLNNFTTFLTLNVADAAASKTESFGLKLGLNVSSYGSSVVGLVAQGLSELRIESTSHAHTLYLTTLGSMTDGATREISGNNALDLRATDGSTSYIDRVTITNTAGVDLSGLENANRAFVSTGVTVTGGAGDDVLLGGIGFDTISTGGGDNTVLGSLGSDAVTLGAGGLDVLVFGERGHSGFGLGFDTIQNFGFFDVIDVSAIADVFFVGSFADNASGIAALSTSQVRAFFNTTTDTLYLDLDHDKALGLNNDMQIVLTGLTNFQASNLIS